MDLTRSWKAGEIAPEAKDGTRGERTTFQPRLKLAAAIESMFDRQTHTQWIHVEAQIVRRVLYDLMFPAEDLIHRIWHVVFADTIADNGSRGAIAEEAHSDARGLIFVYRV